MALVGSGCEKAKHHLNPSPKRPKTLRNRKQKTGETLPTEPSKDKDKNVALVGSGCEKAKHHLNPSPKRPKTLRNRKQKTGETLPTEPSKDKDKNGSRRQCTTNLQAAGKTCPKTSWAFKKPANSTKLLGALPLSEGSADISQRIPEGCLKIMTPPNPRDEALFLYTYRTQLLQMLYSRHQILHKKSTETPTRLLLCSYSLVWWHLPLRSCLPRPSWVLFDVAMTLTRKEERCTSKRKGARKPLLE